MFDISTPRGNEGADIYVAPLDVTVGGLSSMLGVIVSERVVDEYQAGLEGEVRGAAAGGWHEAEVVATLRAELHTVGSYLQQMVNTQLLAVLWPESAFE